MSFKELKARFKAQTIDEVTSVVDAESSTYQKDPRIWYPKMDIKKKSVSVIRFLPAPMPETSPLVRIVRYSFEGPGGKYNELSRQTIKEKDPVQEYWSKLYNAGEKDEARKFSQWVSYISNIIVLEESANPSVQWDNCEKVFLWRYGQTIYDRIYDRLKPTNAKKARFNAFNPWEGANFMVETYEKDEYPQYDKSEFEPPTPLFDGDDDELEKVYNGLHLLQPFKDPKEFKSYEELKALFHKVMGWDQEEELDMPKSVRKPKSQVPRGQDDDDDEELAAPKKKKAPQPTSFEDDDIPEDWGNKKKASKAPVEDDDDLEDDEDETPPPPKKKAAPAEAAPVKKKAPPAPEPDEDEEEEEEEPAPPPKKKKAAEPEPLPKAKAKAKEEDDSDLDEEDDLDFFDEVDEEDEESSDDE